MKFSIGDKLVLAGIECEVALVNGSGHAYLKPVESGDTYNNYQTLTGLVFAVIDEKGRDKLGNRAHSIPHTATSGAV